MESYESGFWFWLLIIGGLAALAVLLTLIALLRRVDSLATVILFNGCRLHDIRGLACRARACPYQAAERTGA